MIFVFSTASRPILRPTQTTMQWVLRAFSSGGGGQAAGSSSGPVSPSSVEVKNCGAIPPFPNKSSWRGA
jgi:hypothetical protein